MKRQTLRALAANSGIKKDNQNVDPKIHVLPLAKKKCAILFKQRFEARMYEDIIPKDVRLQIKSLTRDDVISAMDVNGIVDVDALITISIQRSKEV